MQANADVRGVVLTNAIVNRVNLTGTDMNCRTRRSFVAPRNIC